MKTTDMAGERPAATRQESIFIGLVRFLYEARIGIVAWVCIVLAATAWAGEPEDQTGFSGEIHLGIGVENFKSQLEPGDDNKRIDSLDREAESETEFLPMVAFELEYLFQSGHAVYLGIPFEDEPSPTLGARFDLGHGGELDLSLSYGLPEEVWEDPYITGRDRTETDEDRYGIKIGYEIENLGLSYGLEWKDVDKDTIGSRFSKLRRDGVVHQFEAGYEYDLGNGFTLVPSVGFILANMDGESNEYQGYLGGISLVKAWDDLVLQVSFEAGTNDYDAPNPIFNETREDHTYEAMAILSWLNPLGHDRFCVNVGAGYEKSDSNISFYDTSSFVTFFAIGYNFGAGGPDDD